MIRRNHSFTNNQRVLIAGGAGFIGINLVRTLIEQGVSVVVIDNFSRGLIANLRPYVNQIKIISADLRRQTTCNLLIKNVDLVINLAAISSGITPEYNKDPNIFFDNVALQVGPLIAAQKNRIPRFIQISSASVYSEKAVRSSHPIFESDDYGIPEQSKFSYGVAKKIGELYTVWVASKGSVHALVIRLNNVYGNGDYIDNYGHFLSSMANKLLTAQESIIVYGSGQQRRSFLHVQDAVNAIILVARRGINGEIYNVDSHDEYKVKDVIMIMQKYLKKEYLRVIYDTRLPEGPKRRILNTVKIKQLGWTSQYTLKNTLPSLLDDVALRTRQV